MHTYIHPSGRGARRPLATLRPPARLRLQPRLRLPRRAAGPDHPRAIQRLIRTKPSPHTTASASTCSSPSPFLSLPHRHMLLQLPLPPLPVQQVVWRLWPVGSLASFVHPRPRHGRCAPTATSPSSRATSRPGRTAAQLSSSTSCPPTCTSRAVRAFGSAAPPP